MKNQCTNKDTGKLLHAYELHLLTDDEKDLFETHLLECEFCFNEIREFAPGGLLLKNARDLKAELGEFIGTEKKKGSIWSNLWPDKPMIFRPALLYFLIVIMVWPSINGIKTIFNSNRVDSNISAVQKINLSNLRYDQNTMFDKNLGVDGIIVINCTAVDRNKKYQLNLLDEDNNVIYSNIEFNDFDDYKNAELLFPKTMMRTGSYTVVISGDGNEICRYEFGIK